MEKKNLLSIVTKFIKKLKIIKYWNQITSWRIKEIVYLY